MNHGSVGESSVRCLLCVEARAVQRCRVVSVQPGWRRGDGRPLASHVGTVLFEEPLVVNDQHGGHVAAAET